MTTPKAISPLGRTNLVTRASGIVVPQRLEAEPERVDRNGNRAKIPTSYDPDGRRRVVLPEPLQRQIDKLTLELLRHGFGMVVACRTDYKRADGKTPCGDFAITERPGNGDNGYGCRCSRIHFIV